MFAESETEQLEWLKNHLDPKDTVQRYWNETFEVRRNLLKADTPILTYYESCIALTGNQAKELVCS